ncbi:hypothetical protein CH369_18185 [Leptospira levettii]|uniref:hypothetical protein n=3 Tax=Leptospira levettii TaxID=2023178 RepID=UPI000C2A0D81|nr:hypothetical protein [Leptospira levettii]PJZ86854.1 hypothetical protein CH368_19875 [Leptospira levettii]PJZ98826.1 hypothetical protein CH369_18185 [Leptospira levettii]
MKYLKYLLILILCANCAGSYTRFYSYHRNESKDKNFKINGKLKIAILLNEKENDEQTFNNLNLLSQSFEKSKIQLYAIKKSEKFKSFDLIIMKYSIEDPTGLMKTLQDTSIFLSYFNMIISFGLVPGINNKLKIHTIELFNPSIDKSTQIKFSEYFQENDGWVANYLGKKHGTFSENYNRYYIHNDSIDEHEKTLFKIMEIEGILNQ